MNTANKLRVYNAEWNSPPSSSTSMQSLASSSIERSFSTVSNASKGSDSLPTSGSLINPYRLFDWYPSQPDSNSSPIPSPPTNGFSQSDQQEGINTDPMLPRVDSQSSDSSISTPVVPSANALPRSEPQNIDIKLTEIELWEKFGQLGMEMIVTKNGRNIFPQLAFNVTGLKPTDMYHFYVVLRLADNNRWTYGSTGWQKTHLEVNHVEPATVPHSTNNCIFPTGKYWMDKPVVFKVKISNDEAVATANNFVFLHAMQKYIPVVIVYRRDPDDQRFKPLIEKAFPLASFMAVTTYKNPALRDLKIIHNPYAHCVTPDSRKRKKYMERAESSSSVLTQWSAANASQCGPAETPTFNFNTSPTLYNGIFPVINTSLNSFPFGIWSNFNFFNNLGAPLDLKNPAVLCYLNYLFSVPQPPFMFSS